MSHYRLNPLNGSFVIRIVALQKAEILANAMVSIPSTGLLLFELPTNKLPNKKEELGLNPLNGSFVIRIYLPQELQEKFSNVSIPSTGLLLFEFKFNR